MSHKFYQELYAFFEERKGQKFPRSKEFVSEEGIVVYVRANNRIVPGTNVWENAMVLSRVDVDPAKRGQGLFRDFLVHFVAQCHTLGYDAMWVDQVHNEMLREVLLRNGFVRVPGSAEGEYNFRRPAFEKEAEPEAEDTALYAICDNHHNRYITALVGPDIRTDESLDRAMLITGRDLALQVRDSLRGPQSTRYGITVVLLHAGNKGEVTGRAFR